MTYIVLATYNPNHEFFRKQIESLKSQTFRDWKCLVVDDSTSPQHHYEIASVIKDDNRFKLIKNKETLGVYHNFERGFLLAKELGATLIFPCDQDDIWDHKKLDKMSNHLKNEDTILVHSDASIIDSDDQLLYDSVFQYEGRYRKKLSPTLLKLKNVITGCCLGFKVELLKYATPFPKQDQIVFHHDLWLGLCTFSSGQMIEFCNEQLVQYRLHSSNVIGPQSKKRDRKSNLIYYLKLCFSYYKLVRHIHEVFETHVLRNKIGKPRPSVLNVEVLKILFRHGSYWKFSIEFLIGLSIDKVTFLYHNINSIFARK